MLATMAMFPSGGMKTIMKGHSIVDILLIWVSTWWLKEYPYRRVDPQSSTQQSITANARSKIVVAFPGTIFPNVRKAMILTTRPNKANGPTTIIYIVIVFSSCLLAPTKYSLSLSPMFSSVTTAIEKHDKKYFVTAKYSMQCCHLPIIHVHACPTDADYWIHQLVLCIGYLFSCNGIHCNDLHWTLFVARIPSVTWGAIQCAFTLHGMPFI